MPDFIKRAGRSCMLGYEVLIEQARLREMPLTKIRGILREYLQILILKEIYNTKEGKDLCFTGGTYLRLAHNLKRFSEDLDFNSAFINKKTFESLAGRIRTEFARRNIEMRIRFGHRERLLLADLIFPSVEAAFGVSSKFSKKEGLVIKLETHCTGKKIIKETEVLSGFGETYPCICTAKGILFADKIDALLKKNRARHLYDIIFMLTRKFPVDGRRLKILGITGAPGQVILERVNNISKTELKKQAEALRPFLFEEKDADLIVNAHLLLPSILEKSKSSGSVF